MRKSIFDKDVDHNAIRYGVPVAPGSPETWKMAYEEVMGQDEYEAVLGFGESALGKALRILGFSSEKGLTSQQVKQSYRKLVFKVHPDHGGTQDAFEKVHAAYSLLSDMIQN